MAAGEGALERLGTTRPRGALRKGLLGPLGDQPSPQRQTLGSQAGGGWGSGLSLPKPTPLEHPWGWPNLSSFTSAQPALGNPARTSPGSVTQFRY